MPNPYETWLESQKKTKQQPPSFREASEASRIQYTLPQYQPSPTKKYEWEKKLLGPLKGKGIGKSYEDKFKNITKSMGMSEDKAQELKRMLSQKEDSAQEIKVNKDGSVRKGQNVSLGQGSKTKSEVIDGILGNMIQKTKQDIKTFKNPPKPEKEKKSTLSSVKDGVLKGLEYLDRPGNTVRTGINDALNGRNLLKGAKDGFLGDRHTTGKELNTSLGFDPSKSAASKVAARLIGDGVMGTTGLGGKIVSPLMSKELKVKAGQEIAGVTTEVALDPLNLIGIGIGTKIAKLAKTGKSAKQIAEELKIPVEVVQREFIKGTLPGQEIIDTRAPQLSAPKEDPLKFLTGEVENPNPEVLGLNEPMYKTKVEGLGQEVKIEGTPQLDAPKVKGKVTEEDYHAATQEMENTFKQRQVHEDAFVKEQMKPYDEMLQKSANAELEWQSSVRQAKDLTNNIKGQYGKIIVPEGNWADWGHQVPKQFRANRGETKGIDLYRFADSEGFSSVDEAVQFLKNLDSTGKTKLNDLRPPDHMNISPDQYAELENAARKSFQETDTAKGLDDYFAKLDEIQKGYVDTQQTGDPFSFLQSKMFKTKQEPLEYVGKMDPKDASTIRSEGEFSTRYKETPSGDTLEINPAKPLEFKTQVETKPFKTTIEKEVTRKELTEIITPKTEKTSGPKKEQLKEDLGVNETVKDVKGFQKYTKNIYELAAKLPKVLGDKVTAAMDTAKQSYINHLAKETDELQKIVKGLGIKKGSKESALVQRFGEKSLAKRYLRKQDIDPSTLTPEELDVINLEQLKRISPNKWESIVEADAFFRKKYDGFIDEVNRVRAEIYPDNPEKLVPIQEDYYHHFNELNGFEAVRNLFSSPSNVEPALEGVHANAKFQGFMQKRGTGKYKADAVGGYLKYLRASAHSINIDQVIPVLRKSAKELNGKEAGNLKKALELHANDLAGEVNPLDKKVLGQYVHSSTFKAITWLSNRVRANTVLGNLGTVVAQVGNVPQGIGKAKWSSIAGLRDTMKQTTKEIFRMEKTDPIYQSTFMKERYGDVMFRQFDQRLIDQPKKLAIWMMETADKQAAKFIWNSMYAQGKKKGVKDVMKYADYETRKLVAGRGVGEVPLMQKSKIYQVLAPFTLEVNNQWKVLGEMVGKKDAAAIITTLVASYGLNQLAKEVRGNAGVSFNPMGATIEGYANKDGNVPEKVLGALGSLGGEAIGNVGGGNAALTMLNTDTKVPGTNTKYKDIFGERNPNRYGSGVVLSKALSDPLYAVAPFGASQIRKSTKGLDALLSGGVYKGDNNLVPFTGTKEELNYSIKPSNFEKVKLPLFGPSATKAADKHYSGKMKTPLTPVQTELYKLLKKEDVDLYKFLRESDVKPYTKSKITKIGKNENLSNSEKVEQVKEIITSLTN